MPSTITVPTRQQIQLPVAIADALIALATAAKADLDIATSEATARNVITSIAAYTYAAGVITANANGALGAQDGVTNVAGDIVFLGKDKAAAAADVGLYVVTNVGGAGAKFVLTRTQFLHGAALPLASTVNVGPEGTAWAGSEWRSFGAGTVVIGTGDPLFWPRKHSGTSAAMTAGSITITNAWLRATSVPILLTANTAGGTPGILKAAVGSRTAGIPGTGQFVLASSSGTDTSTVDWAIFNW